MLTGLPRVSMQRHLNTGDHEQQSSELDVSELGDCMQRGKGWYLYLQRVKQAALWLSAHQWTRV